MHDAQFEVFTVVYVGFTIKQVTVVGWAAQDVIVMF